MYNRLNYRMLVLSLILVTIVISPYTMRAQEGTATPETPENVISETDLVAVCPNSNSQILYEQSSRLNDPRSSIYSMNADGSNQHQLMTGQRMNWSPDGTQIVYSTNRDSGNQLFVAAADGTDSHLLISDDSNSLDYPDWSPDGTRIAYVGHRLGSFGDTQIWVVNVDGSNQTKLTNQENLDPEWVDWSPDGTQLVFDANSGGDRDIFIINADGTSLRQLTDNDGVDDMVPVWSPDGTRIYFNSEYGFLNFDIFSVNSDGTDIQNVSNTPLTFDFISSFSPDGRFIAFMSNRDLKGDNYELYVMDLDGTQIHRLTDDQRYQENARWQPCLADTVTVTNTQNSEDVTNEATTERVIPETGNVTDFLESGAVHQWTFEGQAGQGFSLELTVENGTFDPALELLNPDFSTYGVSTGFSGEPARMGSQPLSQTGTYIVLVSAGDFVSSGTYTLTLLLDEIPPSQTSSSEANQIDQISDFVGELSPNEVVQSQVTEEQHRWRYEGSAEQTLTIITGTRPGTTNPDVALYGPDGTLLLSNDNYIGENAQIGPYTLPQSGTYAIVVNREMATVGHFYTLQAKVLSLTTSTSREPTFHWSDYGSQSEFACLPRAIARPSAEKDAQALLILQQRPFNLTKPELFDERAVFAPLPVVSETGPEKTEAQIMEELSQFLTLRFRDQPERVAEGLELLDHPILVEKIPDYRLRAAMLTNLGTVGEVAIDVLLNDEAFRNAFTIITFVESDTPDPAGYVMTYNALQLTQIEIYRENRNSPIEVLGPTLFHELLHIEAIPPKNDEQVNSLFEELINSHLDRSISIQNLLLQPKSWTSGVSTARRLNTSLATLLNSPSEHGGAIDSMRFDGRSVFPGLSTVTDNYSSRYSRSTEDFATRVTPGNPVLREAIDWLSRCSGSEISPNSDFSFETYSWMNELYREGVLFSDAQLLQAASHLGMTPPEIMLDPLPTAYPPLVFLAAPEGRHNIYSLNTDGHIDQRTDSPTDDSDPVWAPDGSQIAFVRIDQGDNYEIYAMNSDGSGLKNITNDPSNEVQPNWSPDGSQLIFLSNRDGSYSIHVMSADGSNPRKLVDGDELHGITEPVWSPDGLHIAFIASESGVSSLYIADISSSTMTKLDVIAAWLLGNLQWSPDGLSLLFISDQEGQRDIYTIDIDGGNYRNLTQSAASETRAQWSPDGTLIAFASNMSGNLGVFIMNADGSEVKALSDTSAIEHSPTWSPDGNQIVFHSNRAGTVELYMVGVDDGKIWRLTNDLFDKVVPLWQPNPDLAIAPSFCTVTAAQNVNLRGGPGTNFEQVGTLNSGTSVRVINHMTGPEGLTWWHLGDGSWVRSDIVEEVGDCDDLPEVSTP